MTRYRTFVVFLGLVAVACSSDDGEAEDIGLDELLNVDALHTGADGTLYAAEGLTGTRVFRITGDGEVNVVGEGLDGPIDIASAPDGSLFVTNFNNATVSRVDADGTVTEFAAVNPFPSGIVRADNGDLYVAHYGVVRNGLGTGDTVLRISPAGDVSTFSEGNLLEAPVGVAFGDDGTLYTANFHDGRLVAIDAAGAQTEVVNLPSNNVVAVGHIAFSNGDLFATVATVASQGTVLRVDLVDGSTTEVPPGTSRPNGIAADPTTGRLFVAPGGTATAVIFVVDP
ncbi:MAG: hypothetical protein AAFY60_10175 [Myxococcota bacterium]